METRIDKYLKENKEEKIIDTEKLTSSLRTSYPEEYGNREKADFKKEVDEAFKELAAKKSSEMRKKDGESGKGGGKGKGRKKGQGNDYSFCGVNTRDIAYYDCLNHLDHCDDLPEGDDYDHCLKTGCKRDPYYYNPHSPYNNYYYNNCYYTNHPPSRPLPTRG